jgi:hypothetical protein
MWHAVAVGHARAVLVVVMAAGCGPATASDPIDCDEAIVPLFDAPEGRELADVLRVGDGVIVEVKVDLEGVIYPPYDHSLLAIDHCGAKPRTLATSVGDLHPAPREGLPWLVEIATTDTSETWLLDPAGDAPHYRVSTSTSAFDSFDWFDDGVVVTRSAADGATYELVAISDSAGTVAEWIAIADVVPHIAAGLSTLIRSIASASAVGELVLVDPLRHSTEAVRSDVLSGFALDVDARLVWFTVADAELYERDWILDRSSGEEILIGRPEWSGVGYERTASMISASTSSADETQVVLLPEGREMWWPGDWSALFSAHARDGTRLLYKDDQIHRLLPGAERPELIYPAPAIPFFADETFYLFAVDVDSYRALRLEDDGSFLDVLDRGVLDVWALNDGRWVYLTGPAEPGELRVRDLQSGDDTLLADDVISIAARDPYGSSWGTRDDVLFVTADQTLWRARP